MAGDLDATTSSETAKAGHLDATVSSEDAMAGDLDAAVSSESTKAGHRDAKVRCEAAKAGDLDATVSSEAAKASNFDAKTGRKAEKVKRETVEVERQAANGSASAIRVWARPSARGGWLRWARAAARQMAAPSVRSRRARSLAGGGVDACWRQPYTLRGAATPVWMHKSYFCRYVCW